MDKQVLERDEALTALLQDTLQAEPIPAALEPAAIVETLHTHKRAHIALGRKGEFRVIAALCASLLIVATVAGAMDWSKKPPLSASDCYMETAGSYHKLYQQMRYLQAQQALQYKRTNGFSLIGGNKSDGAPMTNEEIFMTEENLSAEIAVPTQDGDTTHNVSETITQTAGVQEADAIQTDGQAIYYLQNDLLWYVPVTDGTFGNPFAVKATLDNVTSQTAQKLFLADGVATVLYTCASEDADLSTAAVTFAVDDTTHVPTQTGVYYQEGEILDVRMIDKTLYLVSQKLASVSEDTKESDYTDYVPCCGTARNTPMPADDIYIPDDWSSCARSLRYTIVSAIHTDNTAASVTAAFAGAGQTMYMSNQSLYLTLRSGGSAYNTRITRISIADGGIVPKAVGTVNGYVLNQYSMSEYQDCFRVAAQSTTNTLLTFDMDMNQLGCVSFAPGESIRSVNFVGTRGYVVTFKQTDPLFSIDCSDPANPVIDDAYKVSGYSTFLYPWGDKLLSFGVEQSAAVNGLKLMLYETADDGKLTMLSDFIMGDLTGMSNYYSPATENFHALYLNAEENLIGVPLQVDTLRYDPYTSAYQSQVYYQFFRVTDNGFVSLGTVNFSVPNAQLMRCVSIDGYLYCCADQMICSADMQTLQSKANLLLKT